jgi:cobalt/nickel transport protein
MWHKYRLEVLVIVAVLGFCALFLVTSSLQRNAEFEGSDTKGSAQIANMTGIPEDSFQPLVWQWVPPSGEIESALFAIQAALGGIFVGWVFGYWTGQKKKGSQER